MSTPEENIKTILADWLDTPYAATTSPRSSGA